VVLLQRDGGDTAVATTLDLTVREFSIDGQLTAPAGDVTLRITNAGSMSHNVVFRPTELASPNVGPGGTVELALGELAPGSYELYCNIAGHEASGMVTTLVITGDGEAPAAAMDHGGMDYAAMDAAMMESMLAYPAETEGKGNPVLEPTEVLADGTKVFDLTAEIVDWEIEPGKLVEAWTYNGVVPAPQIILDRGDKIQVRVTNNLPLGTDIHWHGVHTPNDQDGVAPYTQDLIEPNGGTFTYEFTVEDDAIGMYHAHNHAQIQVVNGMFGVFRVGENPIPHGQTISGVTIPDEIDLAVDMPMILNDAGTRASGPASRTTTRASRSIRCTSTSSLSSSTQRTGCRWISPTGSTRSTWHPVSATRCSCGPTTLACGSGTATSSTTWSEKTGCSGW
jgi:FtsP/CotA-like multicopper oxidase with cupredoxin domain